MPLMKNWVPASSKNLLEAMWIGEMSVELVVDASAVEANRSAWDAQWWKNMWFVVVRNGCKMRERCMREGEKGSRRIKRTTMKSLKVMESLNGW